MKRSLAVAFLLASLAGLASPADAEEPPGPSLFDLRLDELMNVRVVTASMYAEPAVDAPANVLTITADEIRRNGYFTLVDILRDVPMIDINYAGQGYQTDIGGRGVNPANSMGKHWQILLDGHDMAWHQFYRNHVSAAWISVDNIERVEIVKGPASAVWGANAYLGVINIITREPRSAPRASVVVGAGSGGTGTVTATASGPVGSSGHIVSTVSVFRENVPRKVLEWSQVKGDDVFLRHNDSHYLAAYTKLSVGDFTLKGLLGIDHTTRSYSSFSVGAEDSVFAINRRFVDADWSHEILDQLDVKLSLTVDEAAWAPDAQYEDNPHNPPTTDAASPERDDEGTRRFVRRMKGRDRLYGGRLLGSWRAGDDIKVVTGAEYKHVDTVRWHFPDVWDAFNLETPRFTSQRYGVFAHMSYTPHAVVRLSGGLRYDHDRVYEGTVSPRASVVVRPVDGLGFKLLFGRAYKAPSLHELYYFRGGTVFGNPELKPEYNNTYEARLMYSHENLFSVSISGFQVSMTDLILYQTRDIGMPLEGEKHFPPSQRPDPNRESYRQQDNAGSYSTVGIEAEVLTRPVSGLDVLLRGTYRNTADGENEDATLEFVAKHKLLLRVDYAMTNRYTFGMTARYLASKLTPEVVLKEPGYAYNMSVDTTLKAPAHFAVGLRFLARDILDGVDLLLKVDNVTNQEYYDAGRLILLHQPRRSFFGRLAYRY